MSICIEITYSRKGSSVQLASSSNKWAKRGLIFIPQGPWLSTCRLIQEPDELECAVLSISGLHQESSQTD